MTRSKTLVAGGTGFVGRFIVERLLREGHDVAVFGRTAPPPGYFTGPVRFFSGMLDPAQDFSQALADADFLVHAAFDHVPGRYRGGEGEDPEGFRRRNLDGSLALFGAAKQAGLRRAIFLSSRAAYGGEATGAILTEDMPCHPGSLYGQVKRATEEALRAMADPHFVPISLRVTGVYGPSGHGRLHKWSGLFADYLAGKPIEPRAGSEVHGDDVAAAVSLMLATPAQAVSGHMFNVSDMLVDRRDILAIVRKVTACAHPLPERAEAAAIAIMATERLHAHGWRPGGWPLFAETVEGLARQHQPAVLG
ncbi:MAG TPA: NAD(P)-dependent oxidoreductase [Rhizobiaceae bacterium]|nr:NAD(P)-dependent oxidoreductase [Rhizobiaceae bacterium]